MRIEASLASEAILVTVVHAGGYEAANAVRRSVSASRYSRANSARESDVFSFAYPLSVDKCWEMRQAWGDRLKVHRSLGDWYRQAAKERAAQAAITTQADAKLPVLAKAYPAFNKWLKGDQRVTAQWIANAYRGGGVLADEVGTGKTAGVVAGLIEAQLDGPILIVCPRISVKAVWQKEITRHTDLPVYACKGSRKQRERQVAAFMADPSPRKILVVVIEMLRVKAIRAKGRIEKFLGYEYPELFDVEWSATVVDESQRVLGSSDVVKGNLAGEGLKALSYRPDRLKLAVSATPFGKGGRIEALFGTLHWVWPDEYPSRWAWLAKYFEINEDRVFVRGGGGATKLVRRVGGLRDGMSEGEFWRELGPRVLRRTMEDVSPEHRGLKNYIEVLCEMDTTQAKQYKAFAQDAELAVEGGIITTVGVLDFMTRCRQFANGVLRAEGGRVRYTGESAKLDRLMLHLEGLPADRKIVVSSQYNEMLDAVEKRFDKEGMVEDRDYIRLDGSTSERKREDIMNVFQAEGGPSIFLLNGQAGGVSITLDAAEELHALDEMYPPEANTQLYGRIFRRGRAHEVFYYLYRSIGTIDEAIAASVAAGDEAQRRLLDGRRGKDYVRKLAQYNPEV
jgi:SNF2 family DNA or RNA helicase